MRLKKHIVLACFLFYRVLAVLGQAGAQKSSILFSSFFAEKSLSSNNITCFFQDSRGYMWIGTQDGLNYFNGKTIRVFKHQQPDKNSLPDNCISTICEDKAGQIWIGTSRGVARLNPRLWTFDNYYTDGSGASLGYKPNVYADKEGNLWVYASEVFKLNAAQHAFKKMTLRTPSVSNRLFTGMFEDSKKRYWLSTNEGLYRFFPTDNSLQAVAHLPAGTHVFPVNEDRAGNIFFGTWGRGLYKINAGSGLPDTIEKSGLYGCLATQRLNGRQLLWYGNVLSSYALNERSYTRYKSENNNPYNCRAGEVSALFTDAQNQLWIGYATKGIQIVSPANQAFKTFRISGKEGMFPVVSCFIKTSRYAYAGGWYNYSLARLDSGNKPLKVWKTLIPQAVQTENNISDAWDDRHGNIWFSSSYGLVKFNEATERTELYQLDTAISKRSFFLQMLPEGDSVLWLAGYFRGLSRFSLKTRKFENWGAKTNALYWGITKDNEGLLWLADNSGLLTGFNPVTKTFISKNYNRLTEGAILNAVIFDSLSNVLWATCANGLLRVDRRTFKARLFTEKYNLPTSQVNAVQFDRDHRLWIATNKGLCFYDPRQHVFKTFFSNNGLPDNVLDQVFKMQPNGDLYIGCRDGFSVLRTTAVHFNEPSQAVTIDNVYGAGKIVPLATSGRQKTIALNYDENDIRIEFSSRDLVNSEDNQLLFRLDGYDRQWFTAQNGVVNYSKLAPGKYFFHVAAINHNGTRSKQDDFLTIIIRPPFWKTAWFITCIAVLIFTLTLLVARYVFTRNLREKILILEKEQAIEKERSRISQDMHDELGSGLTKISILSEVAMTQMHDSARTKSQLEHISSSSRTLVDNLQDIIWILNARNDSLDNLCAYIREYALKYFEPMDVDVRVEFPEKIAAVKLTEDQRRNILLVFKETFNNISKHSGCSQVLVKMHEQGSAVVFYVSDNGRGFDKAEVRSFANGLYNMEKRMADIKGSFSISSVRQQGTALAFKFEV